MDTASGAQRGPYEIHSADNQLLESGNYSAGLRQGPAKAFMNGIHMAVLTYDQGRVVARRFTLPGLRKFADDANRKGWERIQLKAIDERTLGLDFIFGDVSDAKTTARRDDFRKNLPKDVCRPFAMFEQVETVEARLLESAGAAPYLVRRFKRQECAGEAQR